MIDNKDGLSVKCSKEGLGCGNVWIISSDNTKMKKLDRGVHRYYVQCPCCKLTYTVCYSDTRVRKLQKRLRNMLRSPIENELSIAVARSQIKSQMSVLRAKYEDEDKAPDA